MGYAAWCLMGLPVIGGALFGIAHRVETNIRLYLYYLMLCFVMDVVLMVHAVLSEDVCRVAGTLVEVGASNFGEAFLCGTFRTISYVAVAAGVATEVYCLWVVWSFCEDLRDGKSGPELWELLPARDDIIQKTKKAQEGPYGDIVGFAHSQVPGPYGTVGENTSTLFGGGYHDTAYPPRGDFY
eukprot:SRR837773.17037.p1 GENE.SRR837773.17037~~SRR837773.17037.p1  ORF type:complete len:183 (-),score=21.78 SRR837773.17037:40-588(-)